MVFLYSWNHIHVDGMCWSLWPMLIKGGATGEGVVYPGLWGQMEWDLNLLSFIS